MRVLLQRVSHASVVVDDQTVGEIGRGYLLLTGIGLGDTEQTVRDMAAKVVKLRLFNNEAGKFDQSLLDVGGGALVVSQFTLFADTRRGRRPSFTEAASPDVASPLCDRFAEALGDLGVDPVATGRFGQHMEVRLLNDGPVTIWLDSET